MSWRLPLVLLAVVVGPGAAQVAPPPPLRLYVDCPQGCPMDFVRNEIPWVDIVRSRQDADVHLLVTDQDVGGGGDRITLQYIGMGAWQGQDLVQRFIIGPNDTDDQQRRQFVELLKVGLVRYVAASPLAEQLRVVFTRPMGAAAPVTGGMDDPWNNWVFEVGGNGSFDGESQSSSSQFRGFLSAERVTENWKLDLYTSATRRSNRFTLSNGDELSRVSRDGFANLLVGRSAGTHLSVGLRTNIRNSTRDNFDLAWRTAAVVEYSLFPYSESERRFVTLTYGAGLYVANYSEETVYRKLRETRPRHFAVLAMDFVQPWGQAEFQLEAQSYLHDLSKNRVGVRGELDLRVTGGLSFSAEARYSRVRDQLSLARGDASDDEILLELRQLATDYTYDLRIGLSYTFGSIFNTIVNPRFRSGDPAT